MHQIQCIRSVVDVTSVMNAKELTAREESGVAKMDQTTSFEREQTPSRIRVYLVEDQTLIREMLRAMLELEADIEVVGESDRAETALKELEVLPVDIVFMDIGLPGMNGIQATQLLRDMHKDLPIVMLTSSQDENLGQAIEAGATGYLLKTCTRQQVTQAVRDAYQGYSPVDTVLTTRLLKEVAELRRAQPQPISERQVEILKQVANGNNYREVAESLFISETTVNREMRNIFNQLGVNDAAHAVSQAYERGIL